MPGIEFPANRTVRQLFVILGILVVLNTAVAFGHIVLHWRLAALTLLVDLDLESNLPTLFNVLLFFIGAALFHLHGRSVEGRQRLGWRVMAIVFFFLGIDEGSQIHEKFRPFMVRLLTHGTGNVDGLGWFSNAWVIPYGLAGLVLVIFLSRWLFKLDPKLRRGLIISGAIYVLGAIVFESASDKVVQAPALNAPSNFPWMPCEVYANPAGCWMYMEPRYIAMYTLEEVGEMTGLILCIRCLLKAFEAKRRKVKISVTGLED